MYLPLVTGITAPNGIPSTATAGVKLGPAGKGEMGQALPGGETECMAFVINTAGVTGVTALVRLWGFSSEAFTALASSGWVMFASLNSATTIPTQATDLIRYAERVQGFRHFDRIYAEILTIAGTGTSINVYLVQRSAKAGAV